MNNSISNQEENKEVDVSDSQEEKMPSNISNFNVLGKIEIEARNYSQYILDTSKNTYHSKSDNMELQNGSQEISEALKLGLVKLYGSEPNSKGNISIIGHNEQEYFSVLNELITTTSFDWTNAFAKFAMTLSAPPPERMLI